MDFDNIPLAAFSKLLGIKVVAANFIKFAKGRVFL